MTPARHFLAAMRKRSTLSRPFARAARDLAARRRSAHGVAERPRESALLERAGVGLHVAAAAPQLDPEPVRRAVRGRQLDDAREVVRVGRRVVALDHLVGAAVVRLDRAARVVVGPVRPLATGTEVPGVLAVAVGPLGRLVELRPDQGAREAGVVAHYLRLGIGRRPGARGRRRRGRLRGRGRLLLAVLLLLLLGLGLLALLLVVGGGLQAAGVGVGDSGTGGQRADDEKAEESAHTSDSRRRPALPLRSLSRLAPKVSVRLPVLEDAHRVATIVAPCP